MHSAAVAVIGAGPAGASAALHLAREGLDVLLVDRAAFPRDKVCGDGLTPPALQELERLGVREEVLAVGHAVTGCELHGPEGGRVEVASPWRGCVVPRAKLDALLHRRALETGARWLSGLNVTDLQTRADGVELTAASGERIRCRIAIVATGSHASLPIKCGLQKPPASDAVARRAYFANVGGAPDRLVFCYAKDLLPGYGWVFPLGDGRANVGVGVFLDGDRRPDLDRIWTRFLAWLERQGIFDATTRAIGRIGTAQLRTGFAHNRLVGERVLLAGDAAAAINPLSGEGISQALVSGRLAGAAAARALRGGDCSARALAPYAAEVRKEISQVHWYWLVRQLFRSPALVDASVAAAREYPAVGAGLYHTLIGIADPRVELVRCAAGIAGTWAGRLKRVARRG